VTGGRQRRAIGSMDERPPGSGRWRLRVWDVTTQKQRTRTISAKSERGAERQLIAFVSELRAAGGAVPVPEDR
jgi:hypothetical protein